MCLCVFAFYDKATTHTLFAHIRPASRPCPRRVPAGRPCPCWAPSWCCWRCRCSSSLSWCAHHGRCACWMLHTFVLHARRLHLPRGAPPVHSAAAGSRTACHPSFHTCPSSHTVGSGPNTGRKVRGVPGVPPVGAHKPRRARRAVRPGARGNCPGARRRACRRRARAAARQHLANEAGGEAAPAARQLVAGQLRARHADGVVVISLCPLLEPRPDADTINSIYNNWRSL